MFVTFRTASVILELSGMWSLRKVPEKGEIICIPESQLEETLKLDSELSELDLLHQALVDLCGETSATETYKFHTRAGDVRAVAWNWGVLRQAARCNSLRGRPLLCIRCIRLFSWRLERYTPSASASFALWWCLIAWIGRIQQYASLIY